VRLIEFFIGIPIALEGERGKKREKKERLPSLFPRSRSRRKGGRRFSLFDVGLPSLLSRSPSFSSAAAKKKGEGGRELSVLPNSLLSFLLLHLVVKEGEGESFTGWLSVTSSGHPDGVPTCAEEGGGRELCFLTSSGSGGKGFPWPRGCRLRVRQRPFETSKGREREQGKENAPLCCSTATLSSAT